MIKSLSLTNFMKHESLELSFTEGLQVVKGSNESGKSSVLLALAYVFFGAKALRTTFADAVHHGKAESSLKVEMVAELAGRTLNVKRSKGGAEIVENGVVTVTGQTEVTTYLGNLIGADANAAGKLMLANQGNLRGALEQGPKAMSQMIEDLSGMDLFERLIDAMQEKLMMGSTAIVESQLADAQARLATLELPEPVDVAAAEAAIAAKLAESVAAGAKSDAAFLVYQQAEDALNLAKSRAAAKTQLTERAADESTRIAGLVFQESELKAASTSAVSPYMVDVMREKIAEAKNHMVLKQAFEQFSSLTYPDAFWEGTHEEFDKAKHAASAGAAALRSEITEIYSENKVLAQQKVSASICGFCGKDFTDLPEIAAKNQTVDLKIATNERAIATNQAKLTQLDAECNAYTRIDLDAKPITTLALRLENYVTADENFWPHKLSWTGPAVTSAVPDVASLNADLARVQAEVKKASDAAAQLDVVQASLATSRERYAGLMTQISEYDDITAPAMGALEAAATTSHQTYSDLLTAFNSLVASRLARQQDLDNAVARYAGAKSNYDQLQTAVAEKKVMLEQMSFNNNLLRRVRSARPIIADKLWHLVLSSVSTMFSRLRGEVSVLAKGKDGFTCNGKAVETLSGSTLDILGLALRTSLIRTFIPHSPFLILDEPFAATDKNRTAAMLAFIQSTGFEQTILVTHEELSTSVADNLVELS